MRTIKDPKRKPEVRRRTDYEEEEEDCRSTKSTPPKKRKTANSKATSNDNSSLNDSGSFADNNSDLLSERSREDDLSDVSSLKSTPPKKRNYSKLLKQSPEVNGDVHPKVDSHETKPEGKPKGSKKAEKKGEIENKPVKSELAKEVNNKKAAVDKKPGKGGKKKPVKETIVEKPNKNHVKNDLQDTKKSPKGRKVKPSKQEDTKVESPVDKSPPKKKGVNRKRKLVDEDDDKKEVSPKQSKTNMKDKNANDDAIEIDKTAEIQSKNSKKSKKQLKEEATLELKRQTEEQRNAHSVLNKEPEIACKKKTVTPKKKSLKQVESVSDKSKHCKETDETLEANEKSVIDKGNAVTESVDVFPTQAEIVHPTKSEASTSLPNDIPSKPLAFSENPLNETYIYGDDEDEESSDLDTSFESINSVRSSGEKKTEDLDKSHPDDDADKLNDSLESKSGELTELSIKCERCGYISRSKGGHTRHLRKCQQLGLDGESKNPKVHRCERCEYSAPRRVLVINHMKTHGIYQCKRCQYRTDNEETLDQHSGQEHKDRSDCKFCKLCNRYVKCSDVPLEKHMEECQGRIPFKCPECSKEFQYESSLKCHVVSHYPDQPKLFSCDRCDYKSNYKANLKKHIRHIHEQRGEKTIKCTDCDKLFHTEDNMKRHQKLHSEERPHKCEQEGCDKAFKTLNGLKFHLISHQTDRPFLCDVEGCKKGFKSKKSLAMHLNETHQNAPKNFHCTEEGCDMSFYKKCHFERHMAAHTDNRMFFCRWITCTKAFRTAESLKTHMLVHTDEKPVKCEHCDYTCRQRNSIRFHMKKKHPELIPHDLSASKEPSKESSQVSNPTMTTCKTESSLDLTSERLDNKENLMDHMKCEPSSPIRSPVSLPITEPESKLHHAKSKFPKGRTKTNNSLSSSLDRLNNHTIQNHIASKEIKQNVPSNEIKEPASSVLTNPTTPHTLASEKGEPGSIANETPLKKPKKMDMYEFMSEDESEDDMKPGLLRRDYDRDKPPLPPVTGKIDASLLSDLNLPQLDNAKKAAEDKPQKSKKKPGPKPKPKPEAEAEVKVPKKRGRKKKSEVEKVVENKGSDSVDTEIVKPKRGRSPKAKKEVLKKSKDTKDKPVVDKDDDEDNDQKEENPVKKKRGPKKKVKAVKEEKVPEKVPKKRGRKKKGKLEENKGIEPENGDATINYSEVESDKMFADSKDGVSDQAEAPLSNLPFVSGLKQLDSEEECDKDLPLFTDTKHDDADDKVISEKEDEINDSKEVLDDQLEERIAKSEDENDNKVDQEEGEKVSAKSDNEMDTNEAKNTSLSEKEEEKRYSDADSESSDIGSDFDEDLKPPPAPRPPPMYDSEDGDIESGPENEDCNGSSRSNERIRDFESSREISREISRDFESSREIDDSVKTYDPNSVDTSTPKEAVDTPSSVNPYKNDSVGNDFDNQETPHPHSHHSSVPHTPSHGSVPPTPIANPEFESKNHPEETVIKSVSVQGQTNDENTDESSMPEVDKDYVGRFFEEIQCNPQDQITRMNESTKSQDKVTESTPSDSGVASSLTSNQTEASMQMQSPPTDLSHKRMDILPAEHPPEEPTFQTRPESVHRIPERIPSVPTYEPQFNSIDPFASAPLPPRDTILRQTDQAKIPSPLNASSSTSSSFMRFPPDSEAMLQRQRMSAGPYDRNIQNLHRITETAMPSHNNASSLLRHVPGREDVFPGPAGVPGSMSRNPFHSSWTGQDVRPPHWGHPAYLQRPLDQQTGSTPSSLFGKDSYLPGREFMFDPTRAAAERNMFSSLASSHTQRPEIPHDTFQLERFDLGSYLSSHAYNTAPSLPVDYTRSAHSSAAQKSLDERYRQSSTGVTDFRTLPQSSTASDMFGMNSSFNLDKFYPRESMYHSQHISDNTNNPFLPGVPGQHSMFSRDYTHRSFYTQNSAYPFVNMNDKNYSATASAKHSAGAVGQQRELVPVPRPNMAHDPQLQDPYRHSSMLYNMMNRYFE